MSQGLGQQNLILLLVDGVGTKTGQMRVHDLGVEEDKLARSQPLHQFDHCYFGSFRDAKEHGFADEGPTDGQAEDATSEVRALPGFKAIGPSSLMQGLVDFLQLGGDPGGFSVGTTGNYGIKVSVDGDTEAFLVEHSLERLGIAKPLV